MGSGQGRGPGFNGAHVRRSSYYYYDAYPGEDRARPWQAPHAARRCRGVGASRAEGIVKPARDAGPRRRQVIVDPRHRAWRPGRRDRVARRAARLRRHLSRTRAGSPVRDRGGRPAGAPASCDSSTASSRRATSALPAALARVAPEVSAALHFRFDGGLRCSTRSGTPADRPRHGRRGTRWPRSGWPPSSVGGRLGPSIDHRSCTAGRRPLDGRSIHGERRSRARGDPARQDRSSRGDSDARRAEALRGRRDDPGPGSLYTSVLATLVIPGIAEVVSARLPPDLSYANAMTEVGKPTGTASRTTCARWPPTGSRRSARLLVVSTSSDFAEVRARYLADGARPVERGFVRPRAAADHPRRTSSRGTRRAPRPRQAGTDPARVGHGPLRAARAKLADGAVRSR